MPPATDPVSHQAELSAVPWGNRTRLGIILLAAALVTAFYALGWHRQLRWEAIKGNLDEWREIARQRRALSLLAFFAAYVITTSLSLPVALILSLLAGALFDWWLGVGITSLASTTGSMVAFLSSRYVLRDWVRQRFGPRLAQIDRGFNKDGAWYLFSLRLTPLVPFFLINLGMGLTPMGLGTFALVTWLGMLPVKGVLVYAGLELGSIENPRDILSPQVIAALMLLGLTPVGMRLLLRAVRKGTPQQ